MDIDEAVIRALTIYTENKMVFPQSMHRWTNDTAIVDMISPCRNEDDYALVAELFHQLNENIVDGAKCYDLLFEMASVIKKNETEGENTVLCVMRTKNDPDADGSQAIVNELKIAMTMAGGFKHGYSATCFEDIEGLYRKGFKLLG